MYLDYNLLFTLLGLAVGASESGERLSVGAALDGDMVAVTIARPRAFAGRAADELYALDGEAESASLLGAGFTLRLACNLAAELGGGLSIDEDRLTLRLPAALDRDVGQLSAN